MRYGHDKHFSAALRGFFFPAILTTCIPSTTGTQRLQQAVALIGLIHALFDLFSLLTVKAIANDEMMTSVLRPNMVYGPLPFGRFS
jgi:hypothetical protein